MPKKEWEVTDETVLQFIGVVPEDTLASLTGLSKEEITQMKIEAMKMAFEKTYDKPYGWEDEDEEEQEKDKEQWLREC